jgi:hypothetical protein
MPVEEFDSAADAPSAVPNCPKCSGPMWDNREGKRNPKAPDFKCKDRGCDGVIWPPRGSVPASSAPAAAPGEVTPPAEGQPACPICGGAMWDDRASKRNPKAPDFKCKNRPRERGGPGCEGVIWPPRDGAPSAYGAPAAASSAPRSYAARPSAPVAPPPPHMNEFAPFEDRDDLDEPDDDLPF